ncbi:hypothetical protein ACFL6N_03175 [Thermodesulfobacteriota bacterium]
MTKKAARRVKQRNPWIIPSIIFILLVCLLFWGWDKSVKKASHELVEKERQDLTEQIEILETQIAELTDSERSPTLSPELTLELPTALSDMEIPETGAKELTCRQLNERIIEFFTYLDGREYLHTSGIEGGSQAYITGLVNTLFTSPPVIVGETKNLMSILKNTAHFYRILGKKDHANSREILAREADVLELTMALFYQRSKMGEACDNENISLHLPLENLYEYAGFFLNTLGGQAYLFRRDSHLRMLVRYYSILILDRANGETVNRYGIDIRYPLKQMIDELQISETMVYKEEYIRTLLKLQDKYRGQFNLKKNLPPIGQ